MKPGVSAVRAGATKGHSAHLQQVAVALDLLKVPEDPLPLLVGRSVHLPGAVAPLAQTAMEAAVPSDAVAVGVGLEALPAVIHLEVSPVVILLGVSRVAMAVGVAEAVNQLLSQTKRGSSDPFFLSSR